MLGHCNIRVTQANFRISEGNSKRKWCWPIVYYIEHSNRLTHKSLRLEHDSVMSEGL